MRVKRSDKSERNESLAIAFLMVAGVLSLFTPSFCDAQSIEFGAPQSWSSLDGPAESGVDTGAGFSARSRVNSDGPLALELDADLSGLRPGFGFRVGGYGFRDIENDASTNWMDCRMNGLGIFGTLDITPWFFTELSIDYYQATGDSVATEGMDRLSLHGLAAIGFRGFPEFVVSPFVQLGGGAEYARVTWEARDEVLDTALPMGFIGTGGEVKLGDQLRLGFNLRLYMMAGFVPDAADDPNVDSSGHQHLEASDPEPAAAGQLQLWARFDL